MHGVHGSKTTSRLDSRSDIQELSLKCTAPTYPCEFQPGFILTALENIAQKNTAFQLSLVDISLVKFSGLRLR